MLRALPIFFGLIALFGVCRSGFAGTILQPTSVIAQPPLGQFHPNYDHGNLIDQSGLSTQYVNLVDDFGAYFATGPTHQTAVNNSWLSSSGNVTGNLDFSLGGTFVVESLALWNFGSNHSFNLIGFTVLADDDESFSSPTNLGSFFANSNSGPTSAVVPEIFVFIPTSASHIRLQITSNNGGSITGTSEVAFEVAAVPEPPAWLLGCIGAGAVMILGVFQFARRSRNLS